MVEIDLARLEHYMRVFDQMLSDKSGMRFESFTGNSYLQENEGYKARVLAEAQDALSTSNWDAGMLEKTGTISKRAVKAMRLSANLVDYHQHLHFENVLSAKPSEAERALFDIYRSTDVEESFAEAVGVFGAKYDLISYLFFLKDGGRYLPVRPRFFDNSFRILGIDLKMEGRCSWGNYSEYLEAISSVRSHLDSFFGFDEPPTLLDAHSFVWMADILEAYEAGMPYLSFDVPADPVAKDTVAVTKQRIGQEQFRKALVTYWGGRCAVTGCSDTRVLVASHIKPWRVCSKDNEWLNPFNGILLSPNLDSLFDAGLISFEDDGSIIFSEQLDPEDAEKLGVGTDAKLSKTDSRHAQFLSYHRENVLLR